MTSALQAMENRLKTARIPHYDIKVFGAVRINIHVTCKTLDNAEKWISLLVQSFSGKKVYCGETAWRAKKNLRTATNPTMEYGYLVAMIV